ncbi:hypothetical protein BJX61DRAFT_540196 [Aspergillus egyptiacus]|nr:hypothetical protein BJX61DRAFT_540196 [Aspergillus egyptiacus]
MVSGLPSGFLEDLPACAAHCVSSALEAISCASSNTTCICTHPAFLESALECYSLQCTVKQSLASTNATRAACRVPEANEADVTPALAGSLGMLAIVMVCLRILQRTVAKKVFGWDDVFIMIALACSIPLNAMAFPLQKHGLGTNLWTIPFDSITTQLKLLLVAEVFYMPSEAFTQLSFLALYKRLFPPTYNYLIYALAGISICFGVSNTLIMIFQCTPVSYFWTSWASETRGTCIDISSYSWYRAAMQIAMDVSIIALPIRPLSKLALSTRKKVLVMLMFGAGFLITVVSCLRLQSLIKFSKSPNVSMDNNPAIYWSMVECDAAIICACMPCIPALLKPCFPNFFGETHESDHEQPPQHIRLNQVRRKSMFVVLTPATSQDVLVHG